MKRLSATVLLSTFLLISPAQAATKDWIAESNAITEKVMLAQAELSPESFSAQGIESLDDQTLDLGPGIYERTQKATQQIIDDLEATRRTTEHPKVIQDIDILIGALQDSITSNELNQRYMLPYYNLSQGLYFGFQSLLDPRNDPARYPAALVRLKNYTGLSEGHQPITELAKDRSSERFDEPGLLGPYRPQLEKDLQNVPQFSAGLKKLFVDSGLEGWEDDLALLDRQLQEYAEWLEQEMSPRARDDHRLPEDLYANNLKNFGVYMDPQELIRAAQLGFADLQMQMQSISRQIATQRGWENGDYRYVMRKLSEEQIPGDVIEYYRGILVELEAIIRANDIVSLPERDAVIRLATEAEAAAAPVPFLSPPQLVGDTSQQGEFVLVTHDPNAVEDGEVSDFGSPASTWSLTAHEARPGHEMQFAAMLENGVSTARALYALNSANVEGWGLYSEAIMQEYLSLEAQLFGLKARLMRAARAFIDPMLNLGLITPEKAMDFIRQDVGLSKALAQQEIDRYTYRAPGQATSYYVGYMNLMSLRAETELRLGDDFDQRKFHDVILAQGALPPEILRQAVQEELAIK